MGRIVIDTNVFVAALRADDAALTASRDVLRAALTGRCVPLFGNALWHEYEDVLSRKDVWTEKTTHRERENALYALAAAGNARAIVTYNKKDLMRGQLVWPEMKILSPPECLEELA